MTTNRFDCLKESNNHDNQKYDRKYDRKVKKKDDRKDDRKVANIFNKSPIIPIDVISNEFPPLCKISTEKADPTDENDYLKITTKEITTEIIQKDDVAPGFVVISRTKNGITINHGKNLSSENNLFDAKKIDENNDRYNTLTRKLIMSNRIQQREELNDILGDISPYWSMYDHPDDSDECCCINDDSSDSDFENYDDQYQ